MRRFSSLAILIGLSLGCASSRATSDSTTAATEHDPSLHDQHVAAGTASAMATDTSFAAMQARGAAGMGVDQYTSTHTFEPRPDGGRITLIRNVDDSAGVAQIRSHLQSIAVAFAAGNFSTPAFVHAENVPGTDVMAAKRGAIRYSVAPLQHGGELLMQTSDPAAIDAIHRFLAYQRTEHHAGDGSTTPPPPAR